MDEAGTCGLCTHRDPWIFGRLAQGGTVFMPLAAYPFSPLFAWVADRFAVSWQLLLDDQAR